MATPTPQLTDIFANFSWHTAIYATVILTVGFLAAKFISRAVEKLVAKKGTPHQATLVRRLLFYALFLLFLFAALQQIGFQLGVLLGAAGILTVAVGFASQQSMSNLVSGLFLIAERPFKIGDSITVGTYSGEVVNIGLLSAQIRTFDNTQVRIPNQQLITSPVVTLTRYPVRRVDTLVGIAYGEDIEKVRELWLQIATTHELVLKEPGPQFVVLSFGPSSVDLRLSVWTRKANFTVVGTEIKMLIKRNFDNNGIEIPFPQSVITTAKSREPLSVKVQSE